MSLCNACGKHLDNSISHDASPIMLRPEELRQRNSRYELPGNLQQIHEESFVNVEQNNNPAKEPGPIETIDDNEDVRNTPKGIMKHSDCTRNDDITRPCSRQSSNSVTFADSIMSDDEPLNDGPMYQSTPIKTPRHTLPKIDMNDTGIEVTVTHESPDGLDNESLT